MSNVDDSVCTGTIRGSCAGALPTGHETAALLTAGCCRWGDMAGEP